MGNSLHNKIYLGRRHMALTTRRAQGLLLVGAVAGVALVWMAIRTLK
ncbi:MAG: hypothetical protein V4724_32235 [Pseudomonadota bacterium]